MKFSRRLARTAIAMVGFTLLADKAFGAMIAYDSAGDSAYNSGALIGINGGYGWGGPWDAVSPSESGPFLGSSSWLGGPGAATGYINSPQSPDGRAWQIGTRELPDPHGQTTETAIRTFSGALAPGQTFSIDFDADPAGVAVITLGDLSVGIDGTYNGVFIYIAQSLAGPIDDFGPPVTDFGARADFMVLTDSTAQVTITSLAPGGESDSFVLPYSTPMTGVLAENFSFGYLYMNNMSVTPEPDGVALAIAVLAITSLVRRRPRRMDGRGKGVTTD